MWWCINGLHNGFRTRTGGWEFWLLPWRWHILSSPLKAGRGISAETCGLDDVFPSDDLGSGQCTPFIMYTTDIKATFLLIKIYSFLIDIHTKSWYGHAGVLDNLILCGFRCAFSCIFQYSLCHGMDIDICDILHWSAASHNRIANRTGFSVYVVLVLNVIRYSCQYFLDRILFRHDFHHDSCDYHWGFYGH